MDERPHRTFDEHPGEGPAALNLHLHQLACLRAVARCGSIAGAAEALHVSQPALSQALAEIGRRTGVPLFERAGRGRRLTAAGRELLRFAEETLAGAEALSRRLDLYCRGDGGPLHVGMIDAAGLYVLPDVVRRYRAAHPGVDLKLTVDTSDELLRRLLACELDLVFVVGPVDQPGVSAVEVLREPLHIYTAPGDGGGAESARWVLYPRGSRTRRLIDAAFTRAGIAPTVALESSNPAVLRQMVAMGLGWSVLPPAIAEGTSGPAVARRGDPITERPLHAARRAAAPPDARIDAFLMRALEA
jgi:DNA-binding transcriptional LysR family regulator